MTLTRGDRIYLAGPFSEYWRNGELQTVKANIEQAVAFAPNLRAFELVPFIPHIAVPFPGAGMDGWRLAMRECLSHLATTRATLMLPGWDHSRGARVERWVTLRAGRPVFYDLVELANSIRDAA